ncbi:MAG: quinone-dependent dihydroorotate dehydrogenase, partial [Verrucomicrobia bacterium]|nr:quinone-dependent dihydroorotate dehydrogenase [Verrucomicrobiota bacterium]
MNLYRSILRPLFFQLDPERAHEIVMESLKIGSAMPWLLSPLADSLCGTRPSKPCRVAGIDFPYPIGLAAGMDKNGVALPAWEALGFGFVEVGTITAHAQPGNPKPRLFRFPEQEALINRLGFNNEGAAAVACRLKNLKEKGRWPRIPVGINIGKSRITPAEEAAQDYLSSYQQLRGLGDYYVINVSSPNTPGLRDLQAKEALCTIVKALRDAEISEPLFVKVAPDLAVEDLISIVQLAEEEKLSGLIATNTTLDHQAISPSLDQTGGLSGAPLRARSLQALKTIRAHTQLPIIASGGITNAASASERMTEGASLLQIYT